ncbi:MAG: DUF4345 domain-containing protein [Myxococcales bacterium]|nr:DUF4345 domain-containing protein [Myxococcales bacterium]
MTIITRLLTAFYALIGLATGARSAVLGLDADVLPLDDNQFRFYAAIWFTVGLGLAYCVAFIRESTQLFRFLMLALVMGGVGRALGALEYPLETPMIVGIALEFVGPALLLVLQSRIAADR